MLAGHRAVLAVGDRHQPQLLAAAAMNQCGDGGHRPRRDRSQEGGESHSEQIEPDIHVGAGAGVFTLESSHLSG
jgi:hypothetical protein